MEIFISRPNWVSKEYEEGLNNFITLIRNMELTPRTLGITDYPSKCPLDEVIEIMDSCKGVIVLGYPQITIAKGILKSKSISNELVLSTEWNHIEGSIAYAKRLPLLVLHHKTVSRGLFERGVFNAFYTQ